MIQTTTKCSIAAVGMNKAVFVATYRFELSNKFLPCVVNFVHV